MRRRTIFLTLFIVAALAVSATALALPEIRIGIPGVGRLERAETGPLGLKLGLDLQGGSHLVYQAQTGTTLDVSFAADAAADANTDAVQAALDEAGYDAEIVQDGDTPNITIAGEYLKPGTPRGSAPGPDREYRGTHQLR